MRASDAIPLNHSRWGDPEHCCSGGRHNYHFRPGATEAPGALISCCCKSVMTAIEPELPAPCPVCRDTGIVWSPDPDRESVYETACPERGCTAPYPGPVIDAAEVPF